MDILDLDIPNADLIVPGAIAAICLLIMLIAARLSRPRPSALDLPEPEPVAPVQPEVAASELSRWHHAHGDTVRTWIEHHESVLRKVSDQGLKVDLLNADLTSGHDQLALPMRDAVTSHPAPSMRAQLSALVVASEATLHALKRGEYQDAERQHLTYLDYRDNWLQRLRQFSAGDAEIRQLQTISDGSPQPDTIWHQ